MQDKESFQTPKRVKYLRYVNVAGFVITAVVVCLILLNRSDGPKPETERAALGLRGEVEQVTAYYHREDYESVAGEMIRAEYIVKRFGRDGQLLEEKSYDVDNRMTGYRGLVRDGSGRIEEEQYWNSTGTLVMRIEYHYDKGGRKEAEEFYNGNGDRTGAILYEYDTNGRLSREFSEAIYSPEDKSTGNTVYEYDDRGRLISQSYYDDTFGGLMHSTVNAYEDDRRVSSADYSYGNLLLNRVFYDHDSTGNVVREAVYQIPDNEDNERYGETTNEDDMPPELLISIITYNYFYYAP